MTYDLSLCLTCCCSYLQWSAAVQCLAVLDVLMSLSYYSSHGDGNMCRPELVLPEDAEFRVSIDSFLDVKFLNILEHLFVITLKRRLAILNFHCWG